MGVVVSRSVFIVLIDFITGSLNVGDLKCRIIMGRRLILKGGGGLFLIKNKIFFKKGVGFMV